VFLDQKKFKLKYFLAVEYFLKMKLYANKYKHNNKHNTRKLRDARDRTNLHFQYL